VSGLPALLLSLFDGSPSLKRRNRRFTAGKDTARSPRVPHKWAEITLLPCSCSQRNLMTKRCTRSSISLCWRHVDQVIARNDRFWPIVRFAWDWRTSILRRSNDVSSSFVLFRKYPRFRKIDLVGQNFLDLLCVILELYFSKFMVTDSLTSSSFIVRQTWIGMKRGTWGDDRGWSCFWSPVVEENNDVFYCDTECKTTWTATIAVEIPECTAR
jgi:hypothetical protein